MIVRQLDRRMAARLAPALLALGVGLAPSPALAARHGQSRYPAGATRPMIVPRPSDFAPTAPRLRSAPEERPARASRSPRARRAPRKPALPGNAARALVAFQAMQKFYYLQGSGLY